MSTDPIHIATNWGAIRSLAPDRFDAFRRPGDTDELDAVSRCIWNMAVCGTLHAGFHAVEVTFRNQLNNALASQRGSAWYDLPNLLSLQEQGKVADAKQTLQRQRRPLDPGRVIAELSFGFWTSLYGASHEHDIIRPTIQAVFPLYTGSTHLRRSAVAPRLRNIRLLRNRVSHHEPVVFDPQLPAYHQQTIELIQWMNPQMADLTAVVDNFSSVYGQTWKAYLPVVQTVFG